MPTEAVPGAGALRLNPAALRVIRQLSGFTVTSLANAAGIGQAHLSNIEAGRRNASPDVIVQLARGLQVEVPAILANPEAFNSADSAKGAAA